VQTRKRVRVPDRSAQNQTRTNAAAAKGTRRKSRSATKPGIRPKKIKDQTAAKPAIPPKIKGETTAVSAVQPKIIAFYLPQFHAIPENDLWWGEGFTEWTNTRKSKPLFKGHNQPREPESDYYYNLLNPETRLWQAGLARNHGIYGFCYYHYWFKGKLLLERPLQELLQSGEPDFPFCLSWANEPWTRRWDGSDHEVLMPQEYGNEADWKQHFEYLLPVFKDKRYIRFDNKPLFAIYRPASIDQCEEMLRYWQQLAIESGLDGIYFIETMNGFPLPFKRINGFQARLYFEPLYTMSHDSPGDAYSRILPSTRSKKKRELKLYQYDTIWSRILNRKVRPSGKKTFLGAFLDWDNSPRRKYDAYIFEGAAPAKFKTYLTRQLRRARRLGSEFVFINAWNEWSEGTYLEPDKKNGSRYLKAVKSALKRASMLRNKPKALT